MTYKLWDRKSSIYDVTAEQAMKNNKKYRDEETYVFYNDDGSIYDILSITMIPNQDNLVDSTEICQAYCDLLSDHSKTPSEIDVLKDEVRALKEQAKTLEAENAAILYALLTGGVPQ